MLANMSSTDAFKQFLAEMGLVAEVPQSTAKAEKTGVFLEEAFAVYEYWFEKEGMHDYWPSAFSRTQVRDALASEWSTTGRAVKFRRGEASGKYGFDMIRWTEKGQEWLAEAHSWGARDEGLKGLYEAHGGS